MESMMSHPAMAPNFFYYTPDPSCDNRQQGHFVPRPHAGLQHVYPVVPTLPSTPLPSTPVYSRPGSACSQPAMHPKLFGGVPLALTPQASPQLIHHKPTIILDTDLSEADLYYPSTPPLSSSGSVISSPGSCDILQTPLNPMFSGLDGVEGKEAGNSDRQLEEFPNLDWSSCASPPMTPVYLQSQTPTQRLGSVCSNSSSTDLSACPSLSPSPAPYARSSSSPEIDFCDPRNLTVGTVNSTLAPDFSALPTLCAGDDEDHEFVLRGEALKAEPPSVSPSPSFEFNTDAHHGLPNFDELDDIESDNDFVNGLVNLGEHNPVQPTRSRASSDAASLGHSSYTCDDEDFESHSFSDEYLDTPASSVDDCDAHQHKKQRTSSVEPVINMANDTQSQSGSTQQQSTPAAQNSASENKNGSSESNSASDNNPQTPVAAPTNRRGRKQSLTEDPSKTFKCELCNRRFRRQEHLKRHYRSLHTQDKPFECGECGKKFSRSDNLAQHSRTHGSGAIIMNLIDDPDAMHAPMHHGYHPMMGGPHMAGAPDFQTLSKVLFHVSAEIPGSSSELSSDEGSDHGLKRKRSD